MFLMLYDLFLKRKKFLLLYDLFSKKNVSLLYDLSLKRKDVIAAVRYVLNSAKFYFTTYFTIDTPLHARFPHAIAKQELCDDDLQKVLLHRWCR